MDIRKDVLEDLISGSHDAFHEVFKVAYPKVHAFSLGFMKNEADADDITQLVFIKLWMKRDLLANVQNFDTYLYSITKNTVLNHFAANKKYSIDLDNIKEMAAGNETPLEKLEAYDLRLFVDMVVENMPPQRQTIIRMSRLEKFSNDEIAEKLGIQKKTVENHINLALKEIRETLKILVLLV